MSTADGDLVLHLKLDTVHESTAEGQPATVPDVSGNKHTVTVDGSPTLVPDNGFGSCLRFNPTGTGDSLELQNNEDTFARGLTFSSWIYSELEKESDASPIVAFSGNASMRLWVSGEGSLYLWGGKNNVLIADGYPVVHNKWNHVAVAVQEDGKALLYVNGCLLKNARNEPMPALSNAKLSMVTVGRYAGHVDRYFSGKVAHVRLCDRALSTEEIQRQWSLDQAPALDFRVSSPLQFELWDEQKKSAIYVQGGEISHKLTVAIWNRDVEKRSVILGALAENKLKELQSLHESLNEKLDDFFVHNHHLELRFPKGTLSKKACTWLRGDLDRLLAKKESLGENTWYIHYQDHAQLNSESLYLLYPAEKELNASDVESDKPALEIVLAHIATGIESDGQVLPIELRPGLLAKHRGDPATLGKRIRTVEVLSQLGQKYIPLHFDVVGSNTVLNDGEAKTKLLLRITNIDREVSIPIHRTGNRQTRFILACEITDRGGHQEWALTDEAKKVTVQVQPVEAVGSVEPKPDVDDDWHGDPIMASTNGRMIEWEIEGERLGVDSLKPNASVYLRLEVQTALRTGPTDAHLYYRHVPGYWDGSRACTIQKSPLVFHNCSFTRASIQMLDSVDDFVWEDADQFEGALRRTISNNVAVLKCTTSREGPMELNDLACTLGDQVEFYHLHVDDMEEFREVYAGSFGVDGVFEDDGIPPDYSSIYFIYDRFGHQPETSFTSTDESRDSDLDQLVQKVTALLGFSTQRSNEHVGIGTNCPASKLSITDGLTIGSDWANRYQAPDSGLLVQGNVGIGTNQPASKLAATDGLTVGAGWAGSKSAPKDGVAIEGNVGIGTDDPKSKLSVTDGLTIGSNWATTKEVNGKPVEGKQAPADGLLVEGRVGIGTGDPKSKLAVAGRVTIGAKEFDPVAELHVQSPEKKQVAHFGVDHDIDAFISIRGGKSEEAYVRFDNQELASSKEPKAWMVGMDDDEKFKIAFGTGSDITDSNSKLTIDSNAVDIRAPVRNTNYRKSIEIKKGKTGKKYTILHSEPFTLKCEADLLFLVSFSNVSSHPWQYAYFFLVLDDTRLTQMQQRLFFHDGGSDQREHASPSMHYLKVGVKAGKHTVYCAAMTQGGTMYYDKGWLTIIQL